MKNSLPEEFINRCRILFKDDFDHVEETFSHGRPCTFRVNLLKTPAPELIHSLTKLGFELDNAPVENAFVLTNKSQRELTDTEVYKSGQLYIQGLSSMLPPLVLNPNKGDTILDICSAPGSKTTQMAALMQNSGQIIANDMSKVRLYKLKANLKTMGVTNTTTTHFRAQELWKKFPNVFDKVLVDVPCSLEGRFLVNSPKSYAQWSVKKIKIISEHQKHILRSAISSTKNGGTIVYSTCTLAPEENEEVIDWILSKEPTVKLVGVSIPNIEAKKSVTEWNGKKYSSEVSKCVRITPSSLFEGFFLAKFLKS